MRARPLKKEAFDGPRVSPSEQMVQVLAFGFELVVKLIVAFRRNLNFLYFPGVNGGFSPPTLYIAYR